MNFQVLVYNISGFDINTPVGNYNPDWTIVLNEPKQKLIYFVAETKRSCG
ncbi:restriction endonuclease [Tetragenococcus halophilus]